MKTTLLFALAWLCSLSMKAQVYLKEQTQHRFAQTHVGLHYRYQPEGGKLFLQGPDGLESGTFPAFGTPQISIGGLHFWGHLNFVMHFDLPVSRTQEIAPNTKIQRQQFADLGAHFYPWRMEFGKLRPFIEGTYVGHNLTYEQNGQDRTDGWLTFYPEAGLSFGSRNWQATLKATYILSSEKEFYIDSRTPVSLELPPWQLSLGLSHYFDTTLREEPGLKDGSTYALEETLQSAGKLNSLSVGIGGSAGIFLRRPAFEDFVRQSLPEHKTALNLDLGLGYLFHRYGVHMGVAYRDYDSRVGSFGYQQILRRRSVALEGYKFLLDYNGFVPFLGLSLSYDRWAMGDFEGNIQVGEVVRTEGIQPGLIFGWDILPSPLETWVLRTNLRYYPKLEINSVAGGKARVDQLEFNFIQMVFYPQRMYHVGKTKRHARNL
ncbi:MAG: hypothetical protein ACE362_13935 [Phaeodactylibacter xiamenensis]|uniref:Outer membrane protein beta-barrel domain-containing protein n=1 Tax=Phaeodactylibacter xiamenensis TaxID=1524460 RepID=A0A098SA25_9BACT|nr:hypothetical protein [Phaeodactylibacter xiamenensis]KGE87937.1 hypothetical protein IX84_12505 [Phaeodactylibacter xiamenensis]MCR9054828.1 hypothetical protein [bacterium]